MAIPQLNIQVSTVKQALKHVHDFKDITPGDEGRKIPIFNEEKQPAEVGYMVPAPWGFHLKDELVEIITKARNRKPDGFATRFVATPERTRNWLEQIIKPDDSRILFIAYGLSHQPIGQVGLINIWNPSQTVEFDNLIRLSPERPGFLKLCFNTMSLWARDILNIQTVLSYPLFDNESTMRFHRRSGFELTPFTTKFELEKDGEFQWVSKSEINKLTEWKKTGRSREMYKGVLPMT